MIELAVVVEPNKVEAVVKLPNVVEEEYVEEAAAIAITTSNRVGGGCPVVVNVVLIICFTCF